MMRRLKTYAKEIQSRTGSAARVLEPILISRSAPGCPWENGYQESFYDKFKLDLGDPNRFKTLGELVAEIYRTIHAYNTTRIHTALKMPPSEFAKIRGGSMIETTVDFSS